MPDNPDKLGVSRHHNCKINALGRVTGAGRAEYASNAAPCATPSIVTLWVADPRCARQLSLPRRWGRAVCAE
ncbi:hypothetical protein GCM10010199_62440 [Dactylosporangium roseum]